MQLTQLQLTNFRCFGEGEYSLQLQLQQKDGSIPRWVVLAGPNGSGKTSILRAVALLLMGHDFIGPFCDEFSIRAGKHEATLWLQIKTLDTIPSTKTTRDCRLTLEKVVFENQPAGFARKSVNSISPDWFVVGYGPFRRFAPGFATSMSTKRVDSLSGLFREEESRYDSISWLKEVHLRKLESKPDFAALEDGLLRLLGDGLLPLGVKPLRVDSDGLWVSMRGTELPLQRLSDGYQTTAAFVIDLVMRLHTTFRESFKIEERDGKVIIPHAGIVLVDEMEEHLHPAWQQKIGFWLKEHFTGLQFIVTTHSPFICQAADPGGLIRLAAPGDAPAAKPVDEEFYRRAVYGGVDDSVVTELFGLPYPHSERAEKLRERVADLEAKEIEETITPTEQQTLDSLREKLPNTPSAAIEQALRRLHQENVHETNQETLEAE